MWPFRADAHQSEGSERIPWASKRSSENRGSNGGKGERFWGFGNSVGFYFILFFSSLLFFFNLKFVFLRVK